MVFFFPGLFRFRTPSKPVKSTPAPSSTPNFTPAPIQTLKPVKSTPVNFSPASPSDLNFTPAPPKRNFTPASGGLNFTPSPVLPPVAETVATSKDGGKMSVVDGGIGRASSSSQGGASPTRSNNIIAQRSLAVNSFLKSLTKPPSQDVGLVFTEGAEPFFSVDRFRAFTSSIIDTLTFRNNERTSAPELGKFGDVLNTIAPKNLGETLVAGLVATTAIKVIPAGTVGKIASGIGGITIPKIPITTGLAVGAGAGTYKLISGLFDEDGVNIPKMPGLSDFPGLPGLPGLPEIPKIPGVNTIIEKSTEIISSGTEGLNDLFSGITDLFNSSPSGGGFFGGGGFSSSPLESDGGINPLFIAGGVALTAFVLAK